MPSFTPKHFLLALSITTVLAGCGNHSSTHVAAVLPSGFAGTYVIDEAALPAYSRFAASDINSQVDACEAFSDHVNGRWIATTELPADKGSWGSFSMLAARSEAVQHQLLQQASQVAQPSHIEKILGDLWLTGMDMETRDRQGIAPLAGELAAIEALADMEAVVGYIRRSAADGRNVLFEFKPETDFNDPSRVIAYAVQGGLGLPDSSVYADPGAVQAYTAHAAKVLELSGIGHAEANEMAQQAVGLEVRLAKASTSSEALSSDIGLNYNPKTLAEADSLTPNFSWTAFFASQQVPAPEMFSLSMPAFHQEVSKALGDADASTWRAYLRFRTVDAASRHLGGAFVQQNYAFYDEMLRGTKQMPPQWKQVLSAVNDAAGDALGQLYVHASIDPAAKARMEVLVGNISRALKERLASADWLTEATRAEALAKWATFGTKIAYPETWRDWSDLQTQRNSYLGNVHAAMAFNHRHEMKKIGKPVDPKQWEMHPQDVGAYYHPTRNEIVFPAALLQPPFFDASADDAINYGAIGAVIGHEMLHAYDDSGSRFGPTGRMENWWAKEDAEHFKQLGSVLVKQFDSYSVDGEAVNGQMTLGENIADLGGLATAFDALGAASAGQQDPLIDGLTRDQRFFYSWATVWRSKERPQITRMNLAMDPHAPDQVRAMGAPSNLPAFAAAFQCKPGAPMVRSGKERAAIW